MPAGAKKTKDMKFQRKYEVLSLFSVLKRIVVMIMRAYMP